ncbi:DNA binding methylated-DNA--cysteine S-methyltransferase [Acephala macrosclerotiorum]|nr:DNA binding methylated-DNA--cysteine S-methyltransferase [Acephala macrosclerotiorum]
MSVQQLQDSIALGQQILDGEVDLVELDNMSLEVRGKGKRKSGKVSGKVTKEMGTTKRKAQNLDKEGGDREGKRTKKGESSNHDEEVQEKSPYFTKTEPHSSEQDEREDLKPWLKKIALSDKTTFQKKVLTALCQVPRGKYSTYGAISDHLKSSPRAVGNALRNNPFAPQVPCHRILASGGGLGGFHGSWGKNGKEGLHDDKKRKLLREEGVKFDGRGKVVGSPWTEFA